MNEENVIECYAEVSDEDGGGGGYNGRVRLLQYNKSHHDWFNVDWGPDIKTKENFIRLSHNFERLELQQCRKCHFFRLKKANI